MIVVDESEPRIQSERGQPAWDLALLYPPQGEWREEDYLALNTKRLVEFSDGCIKVLPMPTLFHQLVALYLCNVLNDWVKNRGLGTVAIAPLPVKIASGKFREPDVLFLRPERIESTRKPPLGADLVMEVVSDGEEDRRRDLVDKRQEYAAAGIPEYWIVDPREMTITVLSLENAAPTYAIDGVYKPGETAKSRLLKGFEVDVKAAFAAGENP